MRYGILLHIISLDWSVVLIAHSTIRQVMGRNFFVSSKITEKKQNLRFSFYIRMMFLERGMFVMIKAKLKRWLSAAVSAVMICGMAGLLSVSTVRLTEPIIAEAAASDFTADQAINWVKSQKDIPQSLGGTECVALINGYMNYLGVDWTKYRVKYASDFSKPQYCPDGWHQIAGAVPQKGDVLVYSGTPGHVAIYESDDSTWHQNYAHDKFVKNVTGIVYNDPAIGSYWGVLRPNFKDSIPQNDLEDEFWALIMQPSSLKPMVVNSKGKLVLGSNQNKDETAGYWHFNRQDDGSFRIRSYYNNLFLSVERDADENGAVLCVNEWAGGVSQDWWIYQKGDKYKLRPNTSADKVVDIDSGSQEDGAKCQIWHDTDADQQWNYIVKVDPLDLGESFIAEITQESSGKPLVPNANNTIVLGASQNKDKSARWWRFTRNNDHTYSIQSIYNQQFLCVNNKSDENGASIKTISWDGDKVHDWKIFGMGAGLLISPSYTYKALDIDSGSAVDGTKVQLWNAENTGTQRLVVKKITPADYGKDFYAEIDQASSGKPLIVNASSNIILDASQSKAKANQYWHFVQNADGSYKVQSYDTKNYLEAAGAKDEDGTLLVAQNSSSSQSWFIYDYGNMITMIPAFSKRLKALDIDSGSTEDGTRVHLWTASKSDTQSILINKKTQDEITEALSLKGDLNTDGAFDIADVVLLQKWLLAIPNTQLANWEAADMYEDNILDVFDLCIMKRKLIYG